MNDVSAKTILSFSTILRFPSPKPPKYIGIEPKPIEFS